MNAEEEHGTGSWGVDLFYELSEVLAAPIQKRDQNS